MWTTYYLRAKKAGQRFLRVGLRPVEHTKVAEAVGVRGVRVTDAGQLKPALVDALAEPAPCWSRL